MMPAPATLDVGHRRRRRSREGDTRDDLTPRRLEVLVRLYRKDLDGAGAELLDALDTRRDELAGTIGVAPTELPMPGGHEQLPALVALIETRLLAAKTDRVDRKLGEARGLADRVAAESVRGFDGIELDQRLLAELAALGGYDVVGFRVDAELLGIGRALLAALLREVGTVRLTSLRIVAAERALRVGYEGRGCTGWFRIRLEPPLTPRVCVVVDLDAVRPVPVAEDDPVYAPAHTWIDPRPRGPFAALEETSP